MSLADIRAKRQSVAGEVESRVAPETNHGTPEGATGAYASDTSSAEPWGVAQVVTPSGIEIYYQAGPKRLYRLRNTQQKSRDGEGYEETTVGEWVEVPSVSTVLDVLERGGLAWWGQGVGVLGVCRLYNLALYESQDAFTSINQRLHDHEVESLISLLKEHKLTVNHTRDKAADRGTNVHKALEAFAETGVVPDPTFYPENERGYVQALVAFINDAHPHTLSSELMVGSIEHGFAGRFDWLVNLDFAGYVVTKSYPKRKPIRSAVSGSWLIDAKSKSKVDSKTYVQHKIQVAGYEGAMIECGYPPPDHKGILNLFPDGRYELVESHATYTDFLSVLDTYNVLKGLR